MKLQNTLNDHCIRISYAQLHTTCTAATLEIESYGGESEHQAHLRTLSTTFSSSQYVKPWEKKQRKKKIWEMWEAEALLNIVLVYSVNSAVVSSINTVYRFSFQPPEIYEMRFQLFSGTLNSQTISNLVREGK